MARWTRKRAFMVLIFIGIWVTIDLLAFHYQTAEWNRTYVFPDGWLHQIRTISYKGTDFNDTHGLVPEYVSTIAGFPKLGAQDGILPGYETPWAGWTEWTSYNYQIGKDEAALDDTELMCWFAAFRVLCPPGFEGN